MPLDGEQFNALVDQHAAALYRVAFRMMGNRHDAEDIVQETFRSVWSSRDNYQAELGERSWMVAILRRRVVDRWRKRRQPGNLSDHDDRVPELVAPEPLQTELGDEVQQALNRLSPDLREAILLVIVGELTHQEVADQLNVPLGTILSRVSRGRKKLREYLSQLET